MNSVGINQNLRFSGSFYLASNVVDRDVEMAKEARQVESELGDLVEALPDSVRIEYSWPDYSVRPKISISMKSPLADGTVRRDIMRDRVKSGFMKREIEPLRDFYLRAMVEAEEMVEKFEVEA